MQGSSSPARFWRGARRILRLFLLLLPLLLILVVVILYLTAQHIPAWYRPVALSPEDYRRVRADATNFVDSVGDRLVTQEAFDIELSDRALGDWLTALPETWPDLQQDWPRELSVPALKFEQDAAHVGALYQGSRWRGIVNLSLTCGLSADSRELTVRLLEVRAGSLPLPEALLTKLLEPLILKLQEDRSDTGHRARGELDSLADLYAGVTVPNHFVWPNGKRRFRFESIAISEGNIHLRVVPLN